MLAHVGLDLPVDEGEVGVAHGVALPEGGVPSLPAGRVSAHALQSVALVGEVVELALVLGRRHPVARHPPAARLLREDARVAVLVLHGVAIHEDQAVALAHERVEDALVLRRREPVAGLPRRTRGLLPDRGVAGLLIHRVPRHVREAEALRDVLVELRLVLRGDHAVPRDPRGAGSLHPNGRVAVLVVDAVAVHVHEAKALADPLVELGLILGRGEPVPRDPRWARRLLPDGRVVVRVVHLVAADHCQSVALARPLLELGLILRRGQPMARYPCCTIVNLLG